MNPHPRHIYHSSEIGIHVKIAVDQVLWGIAVTDCTYVNMAVIPGGMTVIPGLLNQQTI